VLSIVAAAYLLMRLPKDYHRARLAVWSRCLLLRHLQAIRGWQREMLKVSK
jgi:hypothetical protein